MSTYKKVQVFVGAANALVQCPANAINIQVLYIYIYYIYCIHIFSEYLTLY